MNLILFFTINNFIIAAIFIILAIAVLWKEPHKKINQIYTLMCFSVAWFAFAYGIWHFYPNNKQLNDLWDRLLMLGANFIPILYTHWILIATQANQQKRNKIILWIGYLGAFIISPFIFSRLFITDFVPKLFYPLWPVPGPFFYVYLLFCWGLVLGYGLYTLIIAYLKAKGLQKAQFKYLIIATILGFGGGATNFLLWFNIPIAPWGIPLMSIWGIIFWFAAFRFRLMDIRWVLGRTSIYFLSALAVAIYSFLLALLNQKLNQLISPPVLAAITSLGGIALFFYVFRKLEKVAGKYFYYTIYNLQNALSELTKKINQTIKIQDLNNLVVRSFLRALKIERVAIVFISQRAKQKEKPRSIRTGLIVGFEERFLLKILQNQSQFLERYMEVIKQPLVLGEIILSTQNLKDLYEQLKEFQVGLVLPLLIQNNLIGMILLGPKTSGRAYNSQELSLLNLFSAQAAVAFNNALSYEELKQRKEELERFYRLTVGRELKMIDLKKKIRELETKTNLQTGFPYQK